MSRILGSGTLQTTGEDFQVRYLTQSDVNKALSLQLRIIRDLERNKHNDYIIYKDRSELEAIYNTNIPGSINPKRAIGAFVNGKLIAHTIVTKANPKDLPDTSYDIKENSAEVGSVLTDLEYRGNNLMYHLLDAAQKVAKDDMKCDNMSAVIVPENVASWKSFLDKKYKIVGLNKDPFDGASVYYAYKNISGDSKKSFFINNNDTASISASLNTTKEQKDLFSNGYIITSYDKVKKEFTFTKAKFANENAKTKGLEQSSLFVIKNKLASKNKV